MELLKTLPDNSVDSVVTDAPYGLGKEQDMNVVLKDWLEKGYSEIKGKGFMNKEWDAYVPQPLFWKEVFRVLKPGGHVLSFFGTRTYDIGTMAIRLAGFEIRDQIIWTYGSGFPKSYNVGKGVDKLKGNEREVVGEKHTRVINGGQNKSAAIPGSIIEYTDLEITKGNSQWEGFGSALKPAHEDIVVARKPLSEKNIVENVLKWGTGGINIDGCRVGSETIKTIGGGYEDWGGKGLKGSVNVENEGRFPANWILECTCDGDTHTDPNCPCYILDKQSGNVSQGHWPKGSTKGFGEFGGGESSYEGVGRKDKKNGGASRYFYCAKVSKKERNMGLDDFEPTTNNGKGHGLDIRCSHCNTSMLKPDDCKCETPDWVTPPKKNTHATVKPVQLMAYLVRLVTPPNGVVLDPFMGSGSTGIATLLEGFDFIGMELDSEYFKIAKARIKSYEKYREFIKK